MRVTSIAPAQKFSLEIAGIASDKSLSHRCAIFALLSKGACEVKNYLLGEDTLDSLNIAKALGLQVEQKGAGHFVLTPPSAIIEPSDVLNCGNAGTAMRLYTGLLAGVKGYFVLSGDKYLNARPMKRVIAPLSAIGAQIYARAQNTLAPLSIIGRQLEGFCYESPISSAQVKSAMILAGLSANAPCRFSEPLLSRDHTERMLQAMGVKFETNTAQDGKVTIDFNPLQKGQKLESFSFEVPSDPSSAFYFALATCVMDCEVVLKNVLLNPTRIQAFEVLREMGAQITYHQNKSGLEDVGDIEVKGANLRAVRVSEHISWLIDEIPALSIAFALAQGKSEVRNAKELRVKESDRISCVVQGLRAMGIECEEFEDGFSVQGGSLKPARINSFGDHRIAMSFAIACLACGGEIEDSACIDVSFPNFLELLGKITRVDSRNI
ncbi:3-phosphoshikimate 1-carboxyvinyltransferase [Helicobacter sp. MIT 00-7814]|uniref:3-phosphoshikimate 1-carboxyvinyltransferase n=1 Tax=unclassified Helicobacter TaxID=2593540 RepID=UPI000E1F81BF|nr:MULTISPECIES: 3-phosphoshikimate 1-carboxyvinyltransferase [unclassified Helicobacter]RDU52204.1 3-phosphoshikimate 1-carboxyvinyltransferase [Helicobacter sp. MIT 00-7814]RDU52217.1 3-phosphoshikimate 1-carboxyvinyltransferase [Helicobacter sp. MIT 99-10781]